VLLDNIEELGPTLLSSNNVAELLKWEKATRLTALNSPHRLNKDFVEAYARTLLADAIIAEQRHLATESTLQITLREWPRTSCPRTHTDLSSANVNASNLSEYVRNSAKRYDADIAESMRLVGSPNVVGWSSPHVSAI